MRARGRFYLLLRRYNTSTSESWPVFSALGQVSHESANSPITDRLSRVYNHALYSVALKKCLWFITRPTVPRQSSRTRHISTTSDSQTSSVPLSVSALTSRQQQLRKVLVSSSLLAPAYFRHGQMLFEDIEAGSYEEGEPIPPVICAARPGERPHYIDPSMPPVEQVRLLLENEDFPYSDLLWKLFSMLLPHQVSEYRLPVLLFLARCGSPAELDRMQYLISTTPTLEFNSEITIVAVRLYTRLRNIPQAFQYFLIGLTPTSSTQPLEDLIIYAFWLRDWPLLANVWETWISVRSDTPEMVEVTTIPDFHKLLTWFMKYLGMVDRDDLPDDFSAVPENPPGPEIPSVGKIFYYSFEKHMVHPRFLDLMRQLARNTLMTNCPAWDSHPFLRILGDAQIYENYLFRIVDSRNWVNLVDIYQSYRSLDNFTPSIELLRVMLRVGKELNSVKMVELIYHDWLVHGNYIGMRDLYRLLDYYARRGNPKTVNILWVRHFKDALDRQKGYPGPRRARGAEPLAVEDGPETYIDQDAAIDDSETQINHRAVFREYRCIAYAYQGNVKRCRIILKELKELGVKIKSKVWRAILTGFGYNRDYRGAITLFMQILDIDRPSAEVFAEMMAIAGSQGDIQYALELFGQAKDRGFEREKEILEKVVFAFCSGKKVVQARTVVDWAIDDGCVTVRMFNDLIGALGSANKLVEVEEVINLMQQHGISWNSDTYVRYMQGFNKTRFPEQSWKKFIGAVESHQLIPNRVHMYTMMWGFNLTGQPWRCFEMDRLMKEWGITHDMYSLTALTKALHDLELMNEAKPTMSQRVPPGYDKHMVVNFYKKRMAETAENPFIKDRTWTPGSAAHADMVAHSLKYLTRLRLWDDANELLEMYKKAINYDKLPTRVLPPVMWMQYVNQDYKGIKHSWSRIYSRAINRGKSSVRLTKEQVSGSGAEGPLPEPVAELKDQLDGQVLPGAKDEMDAPFTVMRFVMTQQGDMRGLLQLLGRITAHGFELSRRNWNHTVQVLAQRGMHIPAFDLTEKYLISRWTGWITQRRRRGHGRTLPHHIVWAGRNKFQKWSTSYTLVVLRNEVNKLEEMEAWSTEAASTLEHIRAKCKNVMFALRSWKYIGSKIEMELFGENEVLLELREKRAEIARVQQQEEDVMLKLSEDQLQQKLKYEARKQDMKKLEKEINEALKLKEERKRDERLAEKEEMTGWRQGAEMIGETMKVPESSEGSEEWEAPGVPGVPGNRQKLVADVSKLTQIVPVPPVPKVKKDEERIKQEKVENEDAWAALEKRIGGIERKGKKKGKKYKGDTHF